MRRNKRRMKMKRENRSDKVLMRRMQKKTNE